MTDWTDWPPHEGPLPAELTPSLPQPRPSGYPYAKNGRPDFWYQETTFGSEVWFGGKRLATFSIAVLAGKYLDWCLAMPDFERYWHRQPGE